MGEDQPQKEQHLVSPKQQELMRQALEAMLDTVKAQFNELLKPGPKTLKQTMTIAMLHNTHPVQAVIAGVEALNDQMEAAMKIPEFQSYHEEFQKSFDREWDEKGNKKEA